MCIIGFVSTGAGVKIPFGSSSPRDSLAVRFFEDGVAVFHRGSGSTHLFGLTASAVLDALLAGFCEERDIASHAARLLQVADDNDFRLRVDECIRDIRRALEA